MKIHFNKYHGTGNDFIIIDNRKKEFDKKNVKLIRNLCNRRTGIGADGLMLLEKDKKHDFKMLYFNSDGKEGTMCGNGGRCIVAFAQTLNIISDLTIFNAIDGVHTAKISKKNISLKMSDVSVIKKFRDGYLLDTGSPHFVCFKRNNSDIDVNKLGNKIRNEERFQPNGVNVNFAKVSGKYLDILTYERGVEAETLSCGTGSVAASIASAYFKKSNEYKLIVNTKGGKLEVTFEKKNNKYQNIWLSGPVVKAFEGHFSVKQFI